MTETIDEPELNFDTLRFRFRNTVLTNEQVEIVKGVIRYFNCYMHFPWLKYSVEPDYITFSGDYLMEFPNKIQQIITQVHGTVTYANGLYTVTPKNSLNQKKIQTIATCFNHGCNWNKMFEWDSMSNCKFVRHRSPKVYTELILCIPKIQTMCTEGNQWKQGLADFIASTLNHEINVECDAMKVKS